MLNTHKSQILALQPRNPDDTVLSVLCLSIRHWKSQFFPWKFHRTYSCHSSIFFHVAVPIVHRCPSVAAPCSSHASHAPGRTSHRPQKSVALPCRKPSLAWPSASWDPDPTSACLSPVRVAAWKPEGSRCREWVLAYPPCPEIGQCGPCRSAWSCHAAPAILSI